jgi:uncharacterized membrane protein (UPF0182 family)
MLGFLVCLFWLVVFASPLIISVINLIREIDVPKARWWFNGVWAFVGLVGLWLIFEVLHIWTDVLWFDELGYTARYWTVFFAKVEYFFIGSIIFLIFFMLNIRLTVPFGKSKEMKEEMPWLYPVSTIAGVVLSIFFGIGLMLAWERFLLYKNQVSFNITDPIFGNDIAFYVFSLPLMNVIRDYALWAVFVTIVGMILVYIAISYKEGMTKVRNRVISHISILGILLMGAFIYCTIIAKANIMYSPRGAVFGAGYTDVHVQVPTYNYFIVALVICMIALAVSALAKSIKTTETMAIAGFGLCLLIWLVGVLLIPALYERYEVSPNQLTKETEYIKHNIAYTRQAYKLTDKDVKQFDFPVNTVASADILKDDHNTLENIRLWDWRVLQSVNSQNQAFRLYYRFPDVDVVRYRINSKLVQLMFSGRELDQSQLTPESKTWQNQLFVYTHGFGACANPVNDFSREGLPDYWLKDIPPVAKFKELEIAQPRIYFGESTNSHVYVKTKMLEFDYPKGSQNVNCTYDGTGGVELSNFLRKFAFAWRFDGLRLLTSNEITSSSRIMFRREIKDRVSTLAPFLWLDNDPYQVVASGGLYYLWDAYTWTDHYPYSQPSGDYNYMRNSVKIVVNCFSGKVDFYVFDDKDPVIKAFMRIFPDMFKPSSSMPDSLKQHIRYPEDMLKAQGKVYSVYHMDDPTVFYNKEDAWQISKENSHGQVHDILPYFVIMTLPGEKEEEFVQILPFTPMVTDTKNPRNNMVSWLAARCDLKAYGQLVLYKFPKERLIFGPLQISARINQHKEISKDFTLWNQQGSKVITGNLLVIPLSNFRLLYVQPIYLAAQVSSMPELKMVVIVMGDDLVYAESFDDALQKLVGGVTKSRPLVVSDQKLSSQDMIQSATKHLEAYRKLTGQGKFVEAGKELEKMSQILSELLK